MCQKSTSWDHWPEDRRTREESCRTTLVLQSKDTKREVQRNRFITLDHNGNTHRKWQSSGRYHLQSRIVVPGAVDLTTSSHKKWTRSKARPETEPIDTKQKTENKEGDIKYKPWGLGEEEEKKLLS